MEFVEGANDVLAEEVRYHESYSPLCTDDEEDDNDITDDEQDNDNRHDLNHFHELSSHSNKRDLIHRTPITNTTGDEVQPTYSRARSSRKVKPSQVDFYTLCPPERE